MSKHTKGEWTASGAVVYARIDGDNYTVASANSREVSVAENLANARLIAAAPEMLEALKELETRAASFWAYLKGEHGVRLGEADQTDHNVSEFFAAIVVANETIAKAEGKQ